ncbi:uncharacterized protein SCHCODRAFT_02555490 [Schizophyllum commune H4-8]|nr:uncharacterized protein SCHCODRAFT_02555490 [Schizophyllum commune H4-8]KAI5886482.1 hypothetical protein SCHCODRAFT_02555490 [Schizophyllum commune H4-8]
MIIWSPSIGLNASPLHAPKKEEDRFGSHDYSKFPSAFTSSVTRKLDSRRTAHISLCATASLDHINLITEAIKVVQNAQEATRTTDEAGSLSIMKEEVTEALEKLTAQNFDPDNVALIAQDVDHLNVKVQEQIACMADISKGQHDVQSATSAYMTQQELDDILQHVKVLLLKMKEEHGNSQRTENAVLAAFENQRKAHDK